MADPQLPLFHTQALTVTEVTTQIKSTLEGEFSSVWIRGEISNLKMASSGHVYFSLKDSGASLSAAAFGWHRKRKAEFDLKEGLEVICRGSISVYPPRGNYQLLVEEIEPLGAGALQLAFEQLKLKLQKEGLFSNETKKPMPRYPNKVVVITSPQAAALQDVLTVLRRRAPQVSVLLIPSLVQGLDAVGKLVQAIKIANHHRLGDVILLTRGGGSLEDLWCFNDERLARAIHQSELPVMSAVGHEVDFTISDFVADLRAPTPSAGAEILTQHWVQLRERSGQLSLRLTQNMKREILLRQRLLQTAQARLKSPRDRLRERIQRTDELAVTLERWIQRLLERKKSALERSTGQLEAMSPLRVLSRGYALVQAVDLSGKNFVVRTAVEAKSLSEMRLQFSDGDISVSPRQNPPQKESR